SGRGGGQQDDGAEGGEAGPRAEKVHGAVRAMVNASGHGDSSTEADHIACRRGVNDAARFWRAVRAPVPRPLATSQMKSVRARAPGTAQVSGADTEQTGAECGRSERTRTFRRVAIRVVGTRASL